MTTLFGVAMGFPCAFPACFLPVPATTARRFRRTHISPCFYRWISPVEPSRIAPRPTYIEAAKEPPPIAAGERHVHQEQICRRARRRYPWHYCGRQHARSSGRWLGLARIWRRPCRRRADRCRVHRLLSDLCGRPRIPPLPPGAAIQRVRLLHRQHAGVRVLLIASAIRRQIGAASPPPTAPI